MVYGRPLNIPSIIAVIVTTIIMSTIINIVTKIFVITAEVIFIQVNSLTYILYLIRRFIDVWMIAYDYEVLQSKDLFTEEIRDTVNKLPRALTFSTELNDFIMQFLILNPKDRPKTR